MKLDKQISNEKMAENRDEESGTTTNTAQRATDKETKEQMNEKLAGTSKGGGASPNERPDAPDNKDPPPSDEEGGEGGGGGDKEGPPSPEPEGEDAPPPVVAPLAAPEDENSGDGDNNKLSEELSEKAEEEEEEEKALSDLDEPEKVEQELDENAQKESSESNSESIQDAESRNLNIVNLETIREGEVLEIPPDNISPSASKVSPSKPRFYFDDNTSEYEAARDDGNMYNDDDDDAASVTSLPAELPPPPDGGWGWVIVLVSFLCNAVVDGVAYSFSPFLDTLSKEFDAPKGKVAWIPSLLAGVYLSAGPIVSALCNKFGCRIVCIVGGVIASFAYFITIFATSVEFLMVFQGMVGGFGFGLIYLPAVVCVGYYFESKRALATGIAVCGSGIGTMIFPPLVNHLISEYTWRGANIFIAGMILNCCLFGGLMRPLEVPRMKKKDLLQRLAEEKRLAMHERNVSFITVTNADGTVERRPRNADPGVHSQLNLSGYLTPVGTALALPTIQETQGSTPPEQESPIAASHAQDTSNNTSPGEQPEGADENMSLVNGSNTGAKPPAVSVRMAAAAAATKLPRNCSQPIMARDPSKFIPKNGSVPNFERRFSKVDIANQMKVIPATPKASTTNLRGLGSQDLRRVSSGYGRVSSNASFDVEAVGGLRQRRASQKSMMLRPMSRQDIFYSGSIANLREFKSQASMLSYRESALNLQGTGASRVVLDAIDGPEDEKVCCSCLPESMRGTLSQMMDFSLLKNPVFLMIGVANLFGMLGFYTPFVYLPAAAQEKGVDPEYSTFLISLIGITNTVGRVLSGLIADMPCVSALWINNICIVMSGVCVFLTPLAHSYGSFIALALFFGFFVSPFIALTSIIIVDLLGLRQLVNAFGVLCIFRGLAGIMGPPVSGSIYDATKSYDVSFYSAGGLLFVCAILHCLVPCVQRFYSKYEMPVKYTTNEEYLASVPEESGVSPDTGEGVGIVLDIKPKHATVVHQDSGENKIVLDASQNEKGKEAISAL
ncbi:uncharacterized protein LOC135223692 isoform X1 [Macrobrachium nipponense]|uniref:uncharacterized protein LOC135223692 isoform X1 n=2 Tax=Macrobrachium nipponense TaxID=159736 RepID=UPI0030C85D58